MTEWLENCGFHVGWSSGFHGGCFSSSDSTAGMKPPTTWPCQVAVSQLEVDSKDLLQDDRRNFDIHLLQQSVLLGFFRNPWELWFVCFANCEKPVELRKWGATIFLGGVFVPSQNYRRRLSFLECPLIFLTPEICCVFFCLWNLGCDQIASIHQYFSKRIKVTTAVGSVPIFGIQVDPLRLISIQGILVSSRQTSRLESLEPPNDLLQSMEEVIRRGIPGCV